MKRSAYIMTAILAALIIAGCSPRVIEHVTVRTDTAYVSRLQFDSVWLHDSIYLHEYARNETVFVEKTKWKTVYQEKLRHDTVYISKRDTVKVTKIVEVAKKKNFFQRLLDTVKWIGVAALLAAVALAVMKFKKLF